MKRRIALWLYNRDRAIASLIWGTDHETISGMAGLAAQRGAWWGRALCRVLNWIDPGHCENAARHQERLNQADDGFIG